MVLIFTPINIEVKNIKNIGIIFIQIKKNNFLSFILNFTLTLEAINKSITKNGISITICFPKNISGLMIWSTKLWSPVPVLWRA